MYGLFSSQISIDSQLNPKKMICDICDLQSPQSPLEVLLVGNLGHLTTFYPFLATFLSFRFGISHFLPFGGWQVWKKEIAINRGHLACENIRFSSLFTTGDVSRRGTSAI